MCLNVRILLCVVLVVSQVSYYFPLKNQLRTLMQLPEYVHHLQWESRRATNPDVMTDVYDTPRWKDIAGPPTQKLTRILYQTCVDSFPWSGRKNQGLRFMFV